MRAEGRLGEAEIEVGEARFAAGDRIITRVNDHANAIFNRERWEVAEVDVEGGRLVLDGRRQQLDRPMRRTRDAGRDSGMGIGL